MHIPKKLGIPDYEFRVVVGRTKIDYDNRKEQNNRKKHGYSLESAAHLLERLILGVEGASLYIVSDAYTEKDEIRHMHMSVDDGGHIVIMVTTMRTDEIVRVISFRRADKNERTVFMRLTGFSESNLNEL
jgi:uncharacterized DUF497 family protein